MRIKNFYVVNSERILPLASDSDNVCGSLMRIRRPSDRIVDPTAPVKGVGVVDWWLGLEPPAARRCRGAASRGRRQRKGEVAKETEACMREGPVRPDKEFALLD